VQGKDGYWLRLSWEENQKKVIGVKGPLSKEADLRESCGKKEGALEHQALIQRAALGTPVLETRQGTIYVSAQKEKANSVGYPGRGGAG